MRPAVIILALFCLALSLPPAPKRPHRSAAIHQGAGALALLKQAPPPQPPVSRTIDWVYPPGINPSALWWNVESSTDLRHWIVVITNASGNNSLTVNKAEPLRAFRLSGRSQP